MAPTSPREMLQAIARNLPNRTGKTLEQWARMVKTKGPKQSTWQGDVRVGWDLPKSDEIECVSWGGCQPTYLCQQPKHKHGDLSVSPHDNSIDLKGQREVPGRDEHCWVLWRWKTCPMPRAIG